MKKEYKRKKKILSLLLAVSMILSLSGCGKGGENDTTDVSGVGGGDTTQKTQSESGDGAAAMGRYVETEIDLSDTVYDPKGLYRMEDGSLVMPDGAQGFLVSKDNGDTWNPEMPDWMQDMLEKQYYISELALAPDGTAGVIYDPVLDDDDYTPVMDLILPDGTIVPVELELTEDDMYIKQMEMTQDNRIFISTVCGNIYEVNRDGSGEKVLQTPEYCQQFYAEGSLLIRDRDGERYEAPSLYDMDAGNEIEDEVLADFVRESYSDRYYNGNYYCSMYMLPEDDSVLYLIGSKGIHRHVVGGNMMEQVVDGGLSMLSNPSYTIISAVIVENDAFLVLFSNKKLIRYTYDPDVPTVPDKVLTIYSLREEEDLRQAISMYQSRNPDIFVSYEIGITEGSSVTREDAVKKLNTEIMAGTGPDLIVMDELPFDSYVEKGLLLDLTDYLQEYSAKEPLFDNIIDALKVGGKAYVAPATFHVPVFIGEKEQVLALTDLSKVGEAVEELRAQHPGDDIIGICSTTGVMNRFAPVSAPEWFTKDGALNREVIGEFLEQCKHIYEAQMDGIRPEIIAAYEEMDDYNRATTSQSMWRINWAIAWDIFDYIGGTNYLLSGWMDSPYAYDECTSVERTEGFADSGYADMQGHCSQVFKPNTMLGISTASAQTDMAKDFMGFFLSAEAQENYYSFPLNQAAYDIQFTPDENYVGEDGGFSYLMMSSVDGPIISFTIYFPNEELIAGLKEKFAALNTAYIQDSILEDAVFTGGSNYMNGLLTLEEALDEIEKRVAIYMAE